MKLKYVPPFYMCFIYKVYIYVDLNQ